jgi:hypothetical protein
MRLLAWNIRQGGGSRLPRIADALKRHDAEIVVLSEYRGGPSALRLCAALRSLGYGHATTLVPPPSCNGVLVAARGPFRGHGVVDMRLPEPYRMVSVDFATFRLIGIYMPNLRAKIPYWEALIATLSSQSANRALAIGDFNTCRAFLDEAGAIDTTAHYMDAIEQRHGLSAGGNRIRTIGPAEKETAVEKGPRPTIALWSGDTSGHDKPALRVCLSPIRSQKPPLSLGCPHHRWCGTGIWPDRDITAGMPDVAAPCASGLLEMLLANLVRSPGQPIRAQWNANIVNQARPAIAVTLVLQRQHMRQNQLFRDLRDFGQSRDSGSAASEACRRIL